MTNGVQNKLKELIRSLIDRELEEITTTGNVPGYSTPNAFSDDENERKKRIKKGLSGTGHRVVKEELERNDIREIKALIRKEIADVLKTIWLKRTSWT